MEIAVSTLAFLGLSMNEVVGIASRNDLYIEFSSSFNYEENLIEDYKNAQIRRIPHNYFPIPKDPFVINLASTNESIRARSIEHCKLGLDLAKQSNAPFFSAHSGFCLDPDPDELGKKISVRNYNKTENIECFHQSLAIILDYCDKINMDFLVENNVIATMNLIRGENPLLCCSDKEILQLFDRMSHPRMGLLFDTAHWKVSCNTLDLPVERFKNLSRLIKCVHHSDNDGYLDSNSQLKSDYWFGRYIPKLKDTLHVVEVKNLSLQQIKDQIKLLKTFCDGS